MLTTVWSYRISCQSVEMRTADTSILERRHSIKKKASGFLFLYGIEKEISVGILLDVNCFRDAGITFCQELSAIVEECSLVSWIMNKCQFECVLCC